MFLLHSCHGTVRKLLCQQESFITQLHHLVKPRLLVKPLRSNVQPTSIVYYITCHSPGPSANAHHGLPLHQPRSTASSETMAKTKGESSESSKPDGTHGPACVRASSLTVRNRNSSMLLQSKRTGCKTSVQMRCRLNTLLSPGGLCHWDCAT